jgi:hypothetical protein
MPVGVLPLAAASAEVNPGALSGFQPQLLSRSTFDFGDILGPLAKTQAATMASEREMAAEYQ